MQRRSALSCVRISYYYRLEETKGGRRMSWNGDGEVYLSGHFDLLSVATIESTCRVHTLKEYVKLNQLDTTTSSTDLELTMIPAKEPSISDQLKGVCDPDELTVQCDGCNDWFHPACFGMSLKEVKDLDHFFCGDCTYR